MSTAKKATVEKSIEKESSLTDMEQRISNEFKKNCAATMAGMKDISNRLDRTIDFANIIGNALVRNDISITKARFPYEIVDAERDYRHDFIITMKCDEVLSKNGVLTTGSYKKRFTFEVNIDIDALLKKCFGDKKEYINEFRNIAENLNSFAVDKCRIINTIERHIWDMFGAVVGKEEDKIDNYCNGENCNLVPFLYNNRDDHQIKHITCWMIFSQILMSKFGAILSKNVKTILDEAGNAGGYGGLSDSFDDYNFACCDYNERDHILTIQFACVNTSLVDEWYQWLNAFDYKQNTFIPRDNMLINL